LDDHRRRPRTRWRVERSIILGGDRYVVLVIERLYLFAVALDGQPELERLPVSFVE
jgi:hypothetical protein